MRKTGALILAAFYLLLTTGAFVCLLHCTGDYFFSGWQASASIQAEAHEGDSDHHKGRDQTQHNERGKHKDKDDCSPGKDCDCCDKHGSYVVKENISSSFEFQVAVLAIALKPVVYELPYTTQSSKAPVAWPHTTGPPTGTQPPIYLLVRSLLI